MIPLVENNFNLCELGPRSTGKSHLYKEISPNSILISGGQTTVANLFYNMGRKTVGLVGLWDCVAFDEVAGIKFKDKDGIQIMKDYMASGSFSRGGEFLEGKASMVFVGNINEDILPASSTLTGAEAEQAKAEIRNAIGLLFDRNYIVEEIGQAGQIPASSFVAMGMTNPDGTQFYETAGHSDDYVGYYDVSADAYESNFESAVETLKKYYTYDESTGMITDFPTLTYLYNTSEAHKAIGEYLQSAMAAVGITMNLENQEWATFLNTRKAGDYSIARNGWVADYNDPICFLDMWVTNSGNNDVQFGKGNAADAKVYSLDLTPYGYDTKVENGTWAETYDVLISDIKSCTDPETRYALMHEAEDLLMSTGCIVPLYYYTDIYMLDSNIHGFFSNPLGYKYFMYCTIG